MPSVAEMLDGRTVRGERKTLKQLKAEGWEFITSFDEEPPAAAYVRAANERIAEEGAGNRLYAAKIWYVVGEVVGRGARGKLKYRYHDVCGVFTRPWRTAPEDWDSSAS